MLHSIILLFGLFCFNFASGQSDSIQKQINEQVWKPFIRSYNSGDEEGFKAVHSKDVIRVSQDSKRISGYDEYFKKIQDSIKSNVGEMEKKIELRFIQRIAANGKAFEVAYYKTINTDTTTGKTTRAMESFMRY